MGSNLLKEHAASDIAQGDGTAVNNWICRAANTNLTPPANAPTFKAATYNGGPAVEFDGVNDELRATLATQVANGARPNIYLVLQAISAAGGYFAGLVDTLPNGPGYDYLHIAGGLWHQDRGSNDGSDDVSGAAADTNRHLITYGLTAGGTNSIRVDAATANSIRSGGANGALTIFDIGAINATNFANFRIAHIVATKDAVSAPVDAALVAYLKGNNFPAYTGANYGLP